MKAYFLLCQHTCRYFKKISDNTKLKFVITKICWQHVCIFLYSSFDLADFYLRVHYLYLHKHFVSYLYFSKFNTKFFFKRTSYIFWTWKLFSKQKLKLAASNKKEIFIKNFISKNENLKFVVTKISKSGSELSSLIFYGWSYIKFKFGHLL